LSLGNSNSFPKNCSVGFLLAEKDLGDFGRKAAEIYKKVREEMEKKKKEEEVKKQNKSGVSSLTGIELTVTWNLVKPFIYGWIKVKIMAIASDDIFPPKDTSVTLPSANFNWSGSQISPPSAVEFRGHGGTYLLTYDWELS
jgi:uncharacterized protein YgiM (DUF1202 family)